MFKMDATKVSLKELNILNLDDRKISITLKTNYLNKIQKLIRKYGGIYKLEKASYSGIHQSIKTNRFPLYILNGISNILKLNKVDRYIHSYRSYSGRKIIKNPILKIKESKELTELAGHMLGDGFLTIKKQATSSYTNMSKKLIEEFKNLCTQIFGDINLYSYVDKRFDAIQISLPNQISFILSNFYPELLNKQVPKRLFKLPKELIKSFIRAFADDESCVTTSAILYVQKDKKVLEDIKKLHLLVGFSEENLTLVKRKGDIHTFSIIGDGLKYFYENIGFKHLDKIRDLEVEVKRKNNKRKIKTIDTTKKEITHFLNTPKTIKELAARIGVQPSIIRKHVKKLEKEGYVKIIAYKKYKVPLWAKIRDYQLIDDRRKDKIMNFLKDNQLSTLEISKKIGLSKDRLLTYLYELKEDDKINYKIKGRTYIWYSK